MAGRFPLLTDEDIDGPVVKALVRHGWDVVRAVDLYGQYTVDGVLLDRATTEGRVLVTGDRPSLATPRRWMAEQRSFPGVVLVPRDIGPGAVVRAFEDLAAEESPFIPTAIRYLKQR